MPIGVVQSVSVAGSAVTGVNTGAINTTTGNLIHVDLSFNTSQGFSSFGDMAGNTFATAISPFGTTDGVINVNQRSLYAKNAIGLTGNIYNLTLTGAGFPTILVTEISGVDLSSPLDLAEHGDVVAPGLNPTVSFTTSGTTSQANEIAMAGLSNSTVGFTVGAQDSNYTTQNNQTFGGGGFCNAENASRVLSATGTQTYAPTLTGAFTVAGVHMWIVTYKGAGGGVTPAKQLTTLGAG